jgi:hypothetical protein
MRPSLTKRFMPYLTWAIPSSVVSLSSRALFGPSWSACHSTFPCLLVAAARRAVSLEFGPVGSGGVSWAARGSEGKASDASSSMANTVVGALRVREYW